MKTRAKTLLALLTAALAFLAAGPAFGGFRGSVRNGGDHRIVRHFDDGRHFGRGRGHYVPSRGGREHHSSRAWWWFGFWGPTVVYEPYAYAPYPYGSYDAHPYGSYGGGGREFWGTLLGGAAGGLLGSAIGRGAGNAAAIVGGTVVGALVGGSVGRSMDEVDRLYVSRSLEYVPSHRVTAWENPDTRTHYEVEPLRTYQREDGRYCREYQTKALIGGRWQQTYGTACRQPDGSWQVIR